jgi:hypothetical protein
MEGCFKALGLIYHPLLKEARCYDFYYALFISWLTKNYPDDVNESMCFYNLPFFHEFLVTTREKLPTMEEIRKITQQVSIHNGSFRMIYNDLVTFYKNDSNYKKELICHFCTQIDTMCSSTEEYRKPLYIEYLLHNIFYNIPKIVTTAKNIKHITNSNSKPVRKSLKKLTL